MQTIIDKYNTVAKEQGKVYLHSRPEGKYTRYQIYFIDHGLITDTRKDLIDKIMVALERDNIHTMVEFFQSPLKGKVIRYGADVHYGVFI